MPLRHGQAQHQRDAHSQRHGYLEGGDAVGQRKGILALDEVVGGVVDARAGDQREDAGQQKDRHRRLEQHGADTRRQRQRDDRDEGGCRRVGPVQDGQLIDEPAHRPHQRTAGEGALRAGEEDGEAQRPRPGQKELCRQLAELCACQGHHTTVTPVSREIRLSTKPVPMAMLAAMSRASIIRMVPER